MPAWYGIAGVGGVHVDQTTALDLLRPASGRAHCFADASRSCAGPERTPRCRLPAGPHARAAAAVSTCRADDRRKRRRGTGVHVQWNAAK